MTPSARLADICDIKAAEQSYRCYWCQRPTPDHIGDHLIHPRCGGRWFDPLNVVAACVDCRKDRYARISPRRARRQLEQGRRAVWAVGVPMRVARPRRKRRLSGVFERSTIG